MTKPLSERLEDASIQGFADSAPTLPVNVARLLREAAALARRVEGAAKVKVRGKVGEVCTVPVSHDYCGKRVALVPVEGGA